MERIREYWMNNRRVGFLAVVCFGSSPTPLLPSSVSKLDRRHTGRLRKRDNLMTGEWGGGGRGAESYDRKAWSSINHSVLSGAHPGPTFTVHLDTFRLLKYVQTKKDLDSHPGQKTTVPRRLFFYCPTMNSHRPKSQVTSKEQALIPEKELRRTWPRCHVSLEKSSKNYKPLEKWAKPNLSLDVTPRPANFYGEYFSRICHVVEPDTPELFAVFTRHWGWPKQGRGRGDLRFDIAH